MNSPNLTTDLLGRGAEMDNLDRAPLHATVHGYRQSIDVYRFGVHALNDFADLLQSAYLCIVSLEKIP